MDTTDQKPIDTETVISLLDEEQIKRLLTRRNRMNSLQSGVSPKVDIDVKNMKVYVFSCILFYINEMMFLMCGSPYPRNGLYFVG